MPKANKTTVIPRPAMRERRAVKAKLALSNPKAVLATLQVQQSLLAQIKDCVEILQRDPNIAAVRHWQDRLEFLLSAASYGQLDGVIREELKNFVVSGAIDIDLPSDGDSQLLVGMTFAESSNANDDDEKRSIASCILNMAYYAAYSLPGKTCYNSSFGDGSVLSAIKKGSAAYGSPQWKRVMDGDVLQNKAQLEKTLIPSEIAKLKACILAVDAVADLAAPVPDPNTRRYPLQFNRADDSPPNSQRQEKVARYGSHSFYSFKAGRECQ